MHWLCETKQVSFTNRLQWCGLYMYSQFATGTNLFIPSHKTQLINEPITQRFITLQSQFHYSAEVTTLKSPTDYYLSVLWKIGWFEIRWKWLRGSTRMKQHYWSVKNILNNAVKVSQLILVTLQNTEQCSHIVTVHLSHMAEYWPRQSNGYFPLIFLQGQTATSVKLKNGHLWLNSCIQGHEIPLLFHQRLKKN